MRPATSKEHEQFCAIDGWDLARITDHKIFTKELPDGTALRTQTSLAVNDAPSIGLWKTILREQLCVTEEQFWEALSSGQPVSRPAPVSEPSGVAHKPYVVDVLVNKLDYTAAEVEALSAEQATELINEFWARPAE